MSVQILRPVPSSFSRAATLLSQSAVPRPGCVHLLRRHFTVFRPARQQHQQGSEQEGPRRPLRIAFCGSDLFSIYSFNALLDYAARAPAHIESIDLITRRPKPAGRGRKTVASTPILTDALPAVVAARGAEYVRTHTPETAAEFLEIQVQRQFDLVIAVSYGKLIPHQFLAALPHGGLNVHPSLLPKYSGASPLHMALLNRDTYTGVTVQTLHPTKFDRGDILYQSAELSLPSLLLDAAPAAPQQFSDDADISNDAAATAAILSPAVDNPLLKLTHALGAVGADALLRVIRNRYYEDPAAHRLAPSPRHPYSYAPRIPSSATEILLSCMDTRSILVKNKVLGPLHVFHDTLPPPPKKKKKLDTGCAPTTVQKRVQLDHLADVSQCFPTDYPELAKEMAPGDYRLINITDKCNESASALVFKTSDGFVSAEEIKTEGYSACRAYQLSLSMKKRGFFKTVFCNR